MAASEMADVLGALVAQHGELAGLIADLDESDWQRPSRCEGWNVADVVLHLAQTDELALAALEDRIEAEIATLAASDTVPSTVDEAAEAAVRRERDTPGADIGSRWRTASSALRDALAASDPHRRVTWVAGTLSAHTLAATRLAEAWIHTGDVADAFGITPAPTDRLYNIARLAWRTLPYAFERAGRQLGGPVAFELHAPGGARWELRPDTEAVTTIRGEGAELCLVAARRLDPAETALSGDGPDVDAVLDLVRTYA